MASGLRTKMLGSTSRTGSVKDLSLLKMRLRSRVEAVGAR